MPQSYPDAAITFPMFGSGFKYTASETFHIFGLPLHWYGTIIAVGFILAYIYISKRSKEFGVTNDDLIDLLLWAVPLSIIGARIYYVVFNYSIYQGHFSDVFKIWNGGIAIYGAIIAGVITVICVCHHKKLSVGSTLDLFAFGLLIGQCVGRWGNFVNREAFGRETTVFCRMGLTDASGSTVYVHPTFLYESLWNFVGFLLLHLFSKKVQRKYDGQLFAMYIAWYGLGRALIEGLRTDSLYLFNSGIRVSQLVGGVTCFAALAFLAVNGSIPHDPSELFVNRVKASAAENVSDGSGE
jgi:phosphatidylglycerol:prolipoprotein diacylglycerol transferase